MSSKKINSLVPSLFTRLLNSLQNWLFPGISPRQNVGSEQKIYFATLGFSVSKTIRLALPCKGVSVGAKREELQLQVNSSPYRKLSFLVSCFILSFSYFLD